jgi:hypothetical protein
MIFEGAADGCLSFPGQSILEKSFIAFVGR